MAVFRMLIKGGGGIVPKNCVSILGVMGDPKQVKLIKLFNLQKNESSVFCKCALGFLSELEKNVD